MDGCHELRIHTSGEGSYSARARVVADEFVADVVAVVVVVVLVVLLWSLSSWSCRWDEDFSKLTPFWPPEGWLLRLCLFARLCWWFVVTAAAVWVGRGCWFGVVALCLPRLLRVMLY